MPQGYKQPLQPEDIFEVSEDDRVEVVSADFRTHWARQMAKPGGPSLVSAPPDPRGIPSPNTPAEVFRPPGAPGGRNEYI